LIDALDTISQFRAQFATPLTKVVMGLRSFVATERADPAGNVAQRLKRMPTIIDKLDREPGMELARMHDIGGCRAILPDEETIYRVVERIRARPDQLWPVVREYDYIANPKSTGYRGFHVIVRRDGRLIEIQLRTPSQHRWALNVEAIDLQRRFGVKDGRGPEALQKLLEMSAYAMEAVSRGEQMTGEFDRDFERLRQAANRELVK
jgi:ppGpp synthetase/RelA/SpoT-type nucleotidyltranferase